jgi:long-chain fatty acid transport protein
MNERGVTLLVIGVFSSMPLTLSAGGMRLQTRMVASARGEAFAATADNPSAIYYNPAGITQLEGRNVRSSLYGIYFDPTFTPPSSSETFHVKHQFAAVPQLFYAQTLENLPVSFGLGLYAPYGLGVQWPEDTGFRAVAVKSQLTYLRFNPVVAAKLPGGFSLGAGVMIDYSKIELEQGLRGTQLPPPFVDFFRFEGSGWTAGYNVGLLWQPHQTISVGASFRSSTTVKMQGHTEVEFFPVIPNPYRSRANATFPFPWTAVLGVSYRPTPKWNLEFDADGRWSSFGTITIHQKNQHQRQPIPISPGLAASWIYEFGVTLL